ncbi:Alpha/Beta hydrolase protein [Xylariales sp. PMI_506]|nr:Alpha/Beta hydrolase protein [Xylariales sp. PMI_506]
MAHMSNLENPGLIYDCPYYVSKPPVPLILTHDGGGTTFSYHCLDPTNRPLYGIHNAHFDEGGWWDGGISEMAAHYVELIRKLLPNGGDILLGGWSLGGILSLEMAHQMAVAANNNTPAGAPQFRVLGIVMVDSVFPKRLTDFPWLAQLLPTQRVTKTPEELAAMKVKEKVDLNMTHARVMIQQWPKPRWDTRKGEPGAAGTPPPPTILLHAKEHVTPVGKNSFVDSVRQDPYLGWGPYSAEHGNFIREVVEVEGHHFSIFEFGYVSASSHSPPVFRQLPTLPWWTDGLAAWVSLTSNAKHVESRAESC